jgi:hypothetical protein
LCGVYGPSVMSEWKVQQWVRQFKDGPCVMKIKEAARHEWWPCWKSHQQNLWKFSVHNFRVKRVFHKLHIQYSMKLLQRACTTMTSVQDGCPKC